MYKLIHDDLASKLLIAFFASIFGLLSAFAIKWWEDKRRLRRIRKATESHLGSSILYDLPYLVNDYTRLEKRLYDFKSGNERMEAYEGFNDFIYRATKPEDYFSIYSDRYAVLNQIYAIVNQFTKDFPTDMNARFIKEVTDHMIESGLKSPQWEKHFYECSTCATIKEKYSMTLKMRINECKMLEERIKILLEK